VYEVYLRSETYTTIYIDIYECTYEYNYDSYTTISYCATFSVVVAQTSNRVTTVAIDSD
jgi:hypothetical protein